jgi:hypothetical protein
MAASSVVTRPPVGRSRLSRKGRRPAMEHNHNRPLRPLRNQGVDEARYLRIDSSHQRYEEFVKAFPDSAGWVAKGHMVIVTGEKGYGKTSLIQRCACWLKSVAERQGNLRVVVADLSDEWWGKGATEDARLKMTLSSMLDALGDEIEEAERQQIDNRTEMWEKFRDLGHILAARQRTGGKRPPLVLVVLTQGYPKPAEIEKYYQFARPGLVFFAEVYQREHINRVRQMISEWSRSEVTARDLPLNVLRAGDAEPLVKAIRHETGGAPEVNRTMVEHIDQNIIATGDGVGVGQFCLLVKGALGIAATQGATEMTNAHLLQFFSKFLRGDTPQPDD